MGIAPDDGLQITLEALGKISGYAAATLEYTKYDSLAAFTPSEQAAYAARAKVRLVSFQLTAKKRDLRAVLCQSAANRKINGVGGAHQDAA